MNTAQRRENKYIAQRRDNQIHRTKARNQNKQICENHTYIFIITRKKNNLK
jgi:hypothetical protein